MCAFALSASDRSKNSMYDEPFGIFALLSHCMSIFFTFPYFPNISSRCSLLIFLVNLSTNNVVGSGVGVLFLGDLDLERENERERERYRLLGLLERLLLRENDRERDLEENERLLERENERDLLRERDLGAGLLEPAFAGAVGISSSLDPIPKFF